VLTTNAQHLCELLGSLQNRKIEYFAQQVMNEDVANVIY
jgi:hypothetical protein